jgi:hypothetical protein
MAHGLLQGLGVFACMVFVVFAGALGLYVLSYNPILYALILVALVAYNFYYLPKNIIGMVLCWVSIGLCIYQIAHCILVPEIKWFHFPTHKSSLK